ncbi:MAG: hypothetical protein HOO00_00400 [Rhodospirillaceae bacterium]|jgi:hypothetical protein|nr:hypothetical protein [Rhodospirillaceae bacterium]MBT5373271.1 hypothetical protein [Rhodospirillaceae bacterium]MBT5659197.1 hypothetical protein [Rhodospirillaceae bacterium]MBT5752230.1 hypothetical protein [Rhodospirillaceae bacterium]
MLGLSPFEVLIVAGLIAFLWFNYKARTARESEGGDANDAAANDAADEKAGAIEDMINCPVCDTYVSQGNPLSCGRVDCPYGPSDPP